MNGWIPRHASLGNGVVEWICTTNSEEITYSDLVLTSDTIVDE